MADGWDLGSAWRIMEQWSQAVWPAVVLTEQLEQVKTSQSICLDWYGLFLLLSVGHGEISTKGFMQIVSIVETFVDTREGVRDNRTVDDALRSWLMLIVWNAKTMQESKQICE